MPRLKAQKIVLHARAHREFSALRRYDGASRQLRLLVTIFLIDLGHAAVDGLRAEEGWSRQRFFLGPGRMHISDHVKHVLFGQQYVWVLHLNSFGVLFRA